jgi:hypothetical protein
MDEHDVKYNEKKFKKKVEGNTNVWFYKTK